MINEKNKTSDCSIVLLQSISHDVCIDGMEGHFITFIERINDISSHKTTKGMLNSQERNSIEILLYTTNFIIFPMSWFVTFWDVGECCLTLKNEKTFESLIFVIVRNEHTDEDICIKNHTKCWY